MTKLPMLAALASALKRLPESARAVMEAPAIGQPTSPQRQRMPIRLNRKQRRTMIALQRKAIQRAKALKRVKALKLSHLSKEPTG